MRLGIPVESTNGLSSGVNEHFGMSEFFVLLEVDGDRVDKVSVLENNPDMKEPKTPADILAENGVNIVLAGGIGPHMIKELLDKGIRIFKGAVGTAEQAYEDYKAGMLTEVRTVGEME
jgi:predicted Fe-Mo cluster-binding NifX family protein